MSNTTEKRPKYLRTMRYNWKIRFSSHQGTEKEGFIQFNYRVVFMTHSLILAAYYLKNLTSRSGKKTAGNKTKRRMEYLSTIPRVMMTFHFWNEKLNFTSKEFPASEEKYSLQKQYCVHLIFLYLPCYGTMGLPSPIVFYALVDIVIRFFDNDLSVLMRLSVNEF